MNRIEQFQDDISVMNENDEHVMNMAEETLDKEHRTILSGYSQLIKGQAVLANMLLEVLKSQQQTP